MCVCVGGAVAQKVWGWKSPVYSGEAEPEVVCRRCLVFTDFDCKNTQNLAQQTSIAPV